MGSKTRILTYLIIFVLFSLSCEKKNGFKGIDFKLNISPKITPHNSKEDITTVTEALYFNMDFQYSLNEQFTNFDKNYKVLVHFWREKKKKMLLTEDHSFESVGAKETSNWKKGDLIKYSRKIFIPKYLNTYDELYDGYETVVLTIGLYNSNKSNEQIILHKKNIRIEIEENHAPEIRYQTGWFKSETNKNLDGDFNTWRWTSSEANCLIENKNYNSSTPKNYTLIISGGINNKVFNEQKIIFEINGNKIDEFISEAAHFKKEYIVMAKQMGNDIAINLAIKTNKVFVLSDLNPSSKDKRKLGIQIFSIYFRESIN